MKKFFTATDPVLPLHHPRRLVELAVSLGANRAALLDGSGVAPEMFDVPEARISYAQYAVIERNALRLTNDPALGLRFGLSMYPPNLGMTGIAAMSSRDLAEAFQVWTQYDYSNPAWEIDLRLEGEQGILRLRETIPRGDLLVFATEAMLGGIYALTRQALGRPFKPIEVRAKFSRPAHYPLYAEWFGDLPFVFDQPETEAVFDPAILKEPVTTADPATATLAERFLAAERERHAPVDGLVSQVRKAVVDAGARRVGIERIARALQTSPRSLRRALQQSGTSFQEIVEGVLRARAEERIRAGDTKVELIAQELGFTDARSFRRAFKRWTGHNPNEFRRGPT